MLNLTVPEGYEQQVNDLLSESISVSEETFSTALNNMLDTIRNGGAIRAEAINLEEDGFLNFGPKPAEMSNGDMESRLRENNTALVISSDEGAVFCLCYIKSGDRGYLQLLDPKKAQNQAQAFQVLETETQGAAPEKLNIFQRIVNALSEFFLRHPISAARRIEAYQNFYDNIQRASHATGRMSQKTGDRVYKESQRKREIQALENIEKSKKKDLPAVSDEDMIEFFPVSEEKIEEEKRKKEEEEKRKKEEEEKRLEEEKRKKEEEDLRKEERVRKEEALEIDDPEKLIEALDYRIKNSERLIITYSNEYHYDVQRRDYYQKEVDRLEKEVSNRTKFRTSAEENVQSAEAELKEIEEQLKQNQKEQTDLAEQKAKENSRLEEAKTELTQRETYLKSAKSGASKALEQLNEQQANEKFYNMSPDEYLKHIYDTEKAERLEAFEREKAQREEQIREQQLTIDACSSGIKSMNKNLSRKDRNAETNKQMEDLKTQLRQAEERKKELQLEGKNKQKAFDQIEKEKAKAQRHITEEQRDSVKQWQESGRQELADAQNNYQSCTNMLAEAAASFQDQQTKVENSELDFRNKWLGESAIDRPAKERQQELLQKKEQTENTLNTNKTKLEKINSDIIKTETKLTKAKNDLKKETKKADDDLQLLETHKTTVKECRDKLEELRPSKMKQNDGLAMKI